MDDPIQLLKDLVEHAARTGSEAEIWDRTKEFLHQKRYEESGEPLSDTYDPETCEHEPWEDCMTCSVCGKCRETLDQDDTCEECVEEVKRPLPPPPESYHFSLGNSFPGPVGYCARVTAYSREQAVSLLRATLDDYVGEYSLIQPDDPNERRPAIEYLTVYFHSKAVTVSDIDKVEAAEPTGYHNFYRCEDCNQTWSDADCDSMHDDKCPSCDAAYTPYHSIPLYNAPERPPTVSPQPQE